MKSKYNHWI